MDPEKDRSGVPCRPSAPDGHLSGYIDTTPLPATPTKWRYRAIYRVGDAQVGVWSGVVEITVGG